MDFAVNSHMLYQLGEWEGGVGKERDSEVDSRDQLLG